MHDINLKNAQKASKLLSVPIFTYDQILKDKNIDVVCICAPNKFHMSIILDSLKK